MEVVGSGGTDRWVSKAGHPTSDWEIFSIHKVRLMLDILRTRKVQDRRVVQRTDAVAQS